VVVGKVTQTIITGLAVVLGIALLASTFLIDRDNAGSAPAWFWLLLAASTSVIVAATVTRELKVVPSRSDVVVNLLLAALFLFIASQANSESVTRIVGTTVTFMFLIIGGLRFVRLLMLSVKR
jgi:hypothetical protein